MSTSNSQKMTQIAGYFPFLAIAFLNAFTDLGHKILIQNTLTKSFSGTELVTFSAIIQAMILLPFLLTFTPAGFISDKYPKDRIIKWSAFAAIPIAIVITLSYFNGWFEVAFAMTFLLALQSAIYSPAKYGYIKELVGKKNLAPANSAIQGLTIVAILAGTLAYSYFFEKYLHAESKSPAQIIFDMRYAGFFLIATCVLEFLMTFRLVQKTQTAHQIKFEFKKYANLSYFKEHMSDALSNQAIKQSIIGLSLFWAVNQVLISSFPAYIKEVRGIDDTQLINGILAIAAIGIALGSWAAARASKDYIEIGLIPASVFGMSICLFALPFLSSTLMLSVLFIFFGFFGGLFVVPLNSLIQFHSKENDSGHILAANNFWQTATMVAFLGGTILLSQLEFSTKTSFILLAILNLTGALWALKTFPQSLIRYIIKGMISTRYRLQVVGLNNLPSQGGVLLLGNHISWIDWAVLQMSSPRQIRFVMLRSIYEKWYLKWFLDRVGIIPISRGSSKGAIESISKALKNGEVVALFPEGHISKNGILSLFKSGFERAAQGTECLIVPFYLQGLWGSQFSYAAGKYKESSRGRTIRDITVAFGEALSSESKTSEVKKAVQELSIDAWEAHINNMKPLAQSWLKTVKRSPSQISIIGHDGVQLNNIKAFAVASAFASKLKPIIKKQQNIGLLLPPSTGGILANLACLNLGKTLVNLNYTASAAVIEGCIKVADIKTLVTSKQFLTKLKGKGFDLSELEGKVKFLYLEEIKESVSKLSIVKNLIVAKFLPYFILTRLYQTKVSKDSTAAILFSSGSEGVPKGVELSHNNMVGNLKQISHILNPTTQDVMMCALPLFHAFGLTITTLLPLIEGLPLVAQPDPTDVKAIGELTAKHNITILCGTSTFFRMYANSSRVHPLMFKSLRMVVAGAEKLRPEVRQLFKNKFGLEIYEGYGTTETTPAASTNIPDILLDDYKTVQFGQKPGTVGIALPGSQFKIVDPETFEELANEEAGMILIGGTQLMKGYLNSPEKTNEVIRLINGKRWYISGDKGKLDEDGFLSILDRYSRFAKLGGEMISLGAVEKNLAELNLCDDIEFLATSIPDEKKGEKIILLYKGNIEIEEIKAKIIASELNNLSKPSNYIKLETLPLLGSGKPDFKTAKNMAIESLS